METDKSYSQLSSCAEPCLRQDFLTIEDVAKTHVFLVPKFHLFGIQPREAYSHKSRRMTEDLLKQEEGKGYLTLLQNPAIVVPLFSGNSAYLAITDGHHRTRYLDRLFVPVRFIDLGNATQIYNRHAAKPLSEEEFSNDLERAMSLAQKSFDAMPAEKIPTPVAGASSLETLMTKFEQLPNYLPAGETSDARYMTPNKPVNILEEAYGVVESFERRRSFFDNMNA